jgi:threonylcarbamoyladenosine tRNA methylthiotransferase MtaB
MRVYLDSVGCRLNQSEMERIGAQLRAAGFELVANAADAEWVILNTCAVTAEAASDSRGKARQAARLGAKVVLTGCWATLDAQAAAALPGVVRVIGNDGKQHLVSEVFDLPEEVFDLEPLAREPLPGVHQRTRAFIKAQDGCDHHCTYCITRLARGRAQSVPLAQVLRDVHAAQRGGVKEVVLSGVQLGAWGSDFTPRQTLRDLVSGVLSGCDVPRLRLSSVEPWDLDEAFFALWVGQPRLCRHLHLPLQSGCAATLRRMGRKITPSNFSGLLKQARDVVPQMAITTDLIVGFPGETEDEFAESLDFVRSMHFAGGHVFTYSARPGTPAAGLPNPVHGRVARQRSAQMRAVLAEAAQVYREQFIGQQAEVLWESAEACGPQGWRMSGLTDTYVRVEGWLAEPRWNELQRVRLVAGRAEVLLAEF